jgi:hypothetical protein
MLIRKQVDFGERRVAVRAVAGASAFGAELPPGLAVERGSDRYRNDVVEVLEIANDERAVRPWAGERDIKMIAPALGGKAAFACGARTAVRRDKIAEAGVRPDKTAVGGA